MFASNVGLLRFVVGHTLVFRKSEFNAFGAIDILKDHLIDDEAWGEIMVGRGGKKIWMSRTITHTRYPRATWKKSTDHIIRWGVFWYRFSPLYALSPVLQNSGLAVITLLLSVFLDPSLTVHLGAWTIPLRAAGFTLGAANLVVRTASIVLSNILFGDTLRDLRYFWTIPLRDCYTLFVAAVSPFIRKFVHAGAVYRIHGRRMDKGQEQRRN
jgi:hypothetical protein